MEKENTSLNIPTMKRSAKQERELKVLFGLVEEYLKTGKPVGSHTLKESGFEELSSATIRNYFAKLESLGFLKQQHVSGGRIPTTKAFQIYIQSFIHHPPSFSELCEEFLSLKNHAPKELAAFLPEACDLLSQATEQAVFFIAPKFENDFVTHLKVVPIDHTRSLCILLTDFGTIQTEVLHLDKKLSVFSTKRIEAYFHYRLTGQDLLEKLNPEEEFLAKNWYHELMTRYLIEYTSTKEAGVLRAGYAKLINHKEEFDSVLLAQRLTTFENTPLLKKILRKTMAYDKMSAWIGEDFANESAFLAIPYHVRGQPVGAVGLMGPLRIPYKSLCAKLDQFSSVLSKILTDSLYKHKINFKKDPLEHKERTNQTKELMGKTQLISLVT